MSYSTIIHGIPLTIRASQLIKSWEAGKDTRYQEHGDLVCGFTTLSSPDKKISRRSRRPPAALVGYCGVRLGKYDECGDYVRLDLEGQAILYYSSEPVQLKESFTRILLVPPVSLVEMTVALIRRLPNELRDKCPEIGIYIISSGS